MLSDSETPSVIGSRSIVRGAKVWLRAFEETDLDAYQSAVNDIDVAYWAGYVAPQSSARIRDWYESRVRPQHGKDAYFFVISPLGSRDFMGTIWLWNFDSRLGGAELSLFIADPFHWGKGAGTDAVNALVDFAFGFLTISRIWLYTSVENERAKHAFEKAGFLVEGKIRGHHIRRGKTFDSYQMSILRTDWESLDRLRSWEYK